MESAEYYKQFLLKIYRCKQPFEVVLRDRVTQKRLGSYAVNARRINIYYRTIKLSAGDKWGFPSSLEQVLIHEYAHHIHYTEQGRAGRVHGAQFWCIYSALMARAIRLGLLGCELTEDIILQ